MIKRLFFTISLLLSVFAQESLTQYSSKAPSAKPKLIIGIQINQFRFDYIPRFWDKLSDNGIKKMINKGSYCENTSYNYFFSDIGVGSSTIATGSNPSQHGIIGKSWYDNLKDKNIDYILDEDVETIGGSYNSGRYSPKKLLASTFTDQIKVSSKFRSKIISICLDPAPAVFLGGHTADACYWLDPKKGNWVTSSYYLDSLPDWVSGFNNKRLPDIYMENTWNPLYAIEEYTESLPDDNQYEYGLFGDRDFPYEAKDIAKKFKRYEFETMKYLPYGNNFTKDFAISAIVNEELGKDENTDVLLVSFTVGERIGNLFGPLSVEIQDLVLRLDKELEHFLDFIDKEIGKENVLIYLTSEHGVEHLPEYLNDHKLPSDYFNSASAMSLLRSYMNNLYGKGDWVKYYRGQQIYLNRALIEDEGLSLQEVQANVANLMLQFYGVAGAMTAWTLQNTHFTSGIQRTLQNGYNPKRSGDVIIYLKPGWMDKPILNRSKGEPFGHMNRVPLIWYGWDIGKNHIRRTIDLADIAPTICTFLEIPSPNASEGSIILDIINE